MKGPKFAMPLFEAYRAGEWYAARGYSEEQVIQYLEQVGFRRCGTTVRRVLRAYREQVARG